MEEQGEVKIEQYIFKNSRSKKKNNPSSKNSWFVLLSPLLIAISAVIFYNLGANKYQTSEIKQTQEKFSKLNELIQIIEQNYVDSVGAETLLQSSIDGMLEQLDPHSAYIPVEDVESNNEQLQGHFGGVGIRFTILRDTLIITNVIKGGPSSKAGLRAGDRIIKVNEELIASTGLTNEGVQERLKGQFGSQLVLTIKSSDDVILREVPITRGLIPLPSVSAAFKIKEDIGIIKLGSFSNTTDIEVAEAIARLKKQGVKKLILDLRNNGGGYMHTAINVVDEFLKEGELVVYTQGMHQPKSETYATKYGQSESMQLAVLINSASASASEIVSGALQDNDRAMIIGRRSFGKGLVQRPMKMTDGAELRLTVSRYYTPSGRSIQKPYGYGIDYDADIMERFENGELQEIDSSIFENAEQFITKNGRIVYGGGGIMPDIFVPIDTSGSSIYLSTLSFSEALRNFAFDYVDTHRDQLEFENEFFFDQNFIVTDALLEELIVYAKNTENIVRDQVGINRSEKRLKNILKAEVGSYLFDFSARFRVTIPFDKDVQVAVEELGNK